MDVFKCVLMVPGAQRLQKGELLSSDIFTVDVLKQDLMRLGIAGIYGCIENSVCPYEDHLNPICDQDYNNTLK